MSSAPTDFEFGSFRLDPGKAVLWHDGTLVPLTPKALALLQALVEARGDVVPKEDLMARVWPDTVVGGREPERHRERAAPWSRRPRR